MGEGARAVKKAAACYACLMAPSDKDDGESAKQQRLAAALRANLIKRKARDRAAPPPADGPADAKD
jgi:hypothetical protein